MIEYISETEYEKRFEFWAKRNFATDHMIETRLATRIEGASKMLAMLTVGSPHKLRKALRDMAKEAAWSAQRAMFSDRFVAGVTGQDRNAIPFCGDWKAVAS